MGIIGAKGGCNFSEWTELKNKLETTQTQMDLFIQSCSKELAARLLAKVIKRTPVGDKPKLKGKKTEKVEGASGKTRSFLTAEGARLQTYWSGYSGGTLRRGWTGGKSSSGAAYANTLPVTKAGDVYTIEVTNPVEYASYVEYGHRQQVGRYVPALGVCLKKGWVKGKFMLTISEQEIKSLTPAILENKIRKKLEECLK